MSKRGLPSVVASQVPELVKVQMLIKAMGGAMPNAAGEMRRMASETLEDVIETLRSAA